MSCRSISGDDPDQTEEWGPGAAVTGRMGAEWAGRDAGGAAALDERERSGGGFPGAQKGREDGISWTVLHCKEGWGDVLVVLAL